MPTQRKIKAVSTWADCSGFIGFDARSAADKSVANLVVVIRVIGVQKTLDHALATCVFFRALNPRNGWVWRHSSYWSTRNRPAAIPAHFATTVHPSNRLSC